MMKTKLILIALFALIINGCATWDASKKYVQHKVCPTCAPRIIIEKEIIPCPEPAPPVVAPTKKKAKK